MLPRTLSRSLVTLAVLAASLAAQNAKLKEIKPGWNLFSKDQDVQMGREYSQQIEKELDVINGGPLTSYIQELGAKIATQPMANGFPYTFKVINDPTINAFALPGGPIYINSGAWTASRLDPESAVPLRSGYRRSFLGSSMAACRMSSVG
jgi:beta-barrel assembly-enhancing protease